MGGARRKPVFQDQHKSASVVLARLRNLHHLMECGSSSQHFQWLHHFYLIVDRVVNRHRVYKVFGAAQGFMVSTNIAVEDPQHAVTLLSFTRHLLTSLQNVCMPGGQPLDLVLAVTSCEMCSGLLGSTSLTYQVVGCGQAVVQELAEHQPELGAMFTSEFHAALRESAAGAAAAGSMALVGRYRPRGAQAGEVGIYTLVECEGGRLYTADELFNYPVSTGPAGKPSPVAAAGACESLPSSEPTACDGQASTHSVSTAGEGTGQQPHQQERQAAEHTDVKGAQESAAQEAVQEPAPADRLPPPVNGQMVPKGNSCNVEGEIPAQQTQQMPACSRQDTCWSLCSLVLWASYALLVRSWYGNTAAAWQLLPLYVVPCAMMWLLYRHPELYARYRDDAWLLHRSLTALVCSSPGSFAFRDPLSSRLLAFGMWPLLLDVLGRPVRFHVQLATCAVVYMLSLSFMSTHAPGSPGHQRVNAGFLAVHFGVVVLLPVVASYCWDSNHRKRLQARDAHGKAG